MVFRRFANVTCPSLVRISLFAKSQADREAFSEHRLSTKISFRAYFLKLLTYLLFWKVDK